MTTRFFTFSQDNISGLFKGPARTIVVQADSPDAANDAVQAKGVSFTDFCNCCGPRWKQVDQSDVDDFDDGDSGRVFGTFDDAMDHISFFGDDQDFIFVVAR